MPVGKSRPIAIASATLIAFLFALSGVADAAPVTIEGTITETGTGTPIESATVVISAPAQGSRDFGVLSTGTTNALGEYSIDVPMETDDLDIIVEAAGALHAPARYNFPGELSCFFNCGAGGEFMISPGDPPHTGIDFTLDAGGTISGAITHASNATPLQNAFVELLPESLFPYSSHFRGVADASGDYAVNLAVAPGNYHLRANPAPGENFVVQAWNNYPCQFGSCPILDTDPIEVEAGINKPGFDFALSPGASIAGALQPDDIGRIVRLFDGAGIMLDQFIFFTGFPDADWGFDGLSGGSYYIEFGPFTGDSPYIRILHNDLLCPFGGCNRARGVPITIPPGSSLSLAQIDLPVGGQIEGTIVASTGSLPTIDPNSSFGTYDIISADGQVVGGGSLREDEGNLVLTTSSAVPPGDYYVRTYNDWLGNGIGYTTPGSSQATLPEYMDAVYPNVPCAGLACDLSAATPVTVTANNTTTITMEIDTGSRISGSVVDNGTDTPIGSTVVKLVDSDNTLMASVATDAGGEFSFGAFPAGIYYLRTAMSAAYGAGHFGFQNAYFDKVHGAPDNCSEQLCDPTSGTTIVLDGSKDAGPFELRVDPGPVISGRILFSLTGLVINNGHVEVFNDTGDFVGSYRINPTSGRYQTTALAAGDYTLVPVVSPAYSDVTTSSSTTSSTTTESLEGSVPQSESAVSASRSSGSLVVTVGTEDVVADLRVIDDGLDVIFGDEFQFDD